MSTHVLLKLLNKFGKKERGLPRILTLFRCKLNSIKQEHKCKILFIIMRPK